MKTTPKTVLFAFLLSALTAPLWAQGTYTAASCNQSDVNAVINGPTHTAVDGDVIKVPGGTCTWNSGIAIPAGIGITIQGAGTPNSTPSTRGPSSSCSTTVITDNISAARGYMFTFQPGVNSSLTRISCMKFFGQSGLTSNAIHSPIGIAGTCNSSTCSKFRADNLSFDSSLEGVIADSNSLILIDNVFGVADHNTTLSVFGKTGDAFVSFNHSAYNGIGQYGDNSWTAPNSFGTDHTFYLENNVFGPNTNPTESEAGAPNGGEGGGRAATRFNDCNGCIQGFANHGTDSNGRPRGGRQAEFYNNNYQCQDTSAGCQGGIAVRSGVNLMFNNSMTVASGSWFNAYMNLTDMRVRTIWSSPWGQCPGPYDLASPLTCTDQPSRSGSRLLSGATPTTGWTNEVIDPSYEWNDSGKSPNFSNVSAGPPSMLANQDWWTDGTAGTATPQTGVGTPFTGAPQSDGKGGIGYGPLAFRPNTCTTNPVSGVAGAGYWATDQGPFWNNGTTQGQLYVCRDATNHVDINGSATACTQAQDSNHFWCLYYKPYTYPHPLIGGATVANPPNPPSDLQTVVH
jgi:hypothetical protein